MAENKERTFIMIKPDGVQRGLVGKIIQRFEEKGFKLVAMKMVWVSILAYCLKEKKNMRILLSCTTWIFPDWHIVFSRFS